MTNRILATLVASSVLIGVAAPAVHAENAMGYQLLSMSDAAQLPRNHGALGLNVERSQEITDAGMTFEVMRVTQVRRGSPGAQAGFRPGDQIIAVNGRVFPTIAAFANYIGSMPPGNRATVDYIPLGGGPAQAQRIAVVVGGQGGNTGPASNPSGKTESTGMSTGSKIAIGVGAAALLGCYELGCFNRRSGATTPANNGQPQYNQPQYNRQPQYNGQPQPNGQPQSGQLGQ